MTYSTHDIPVSGGLLRVGEWRPDATRAHSSALPNDEAPIVIALHGMTGSHLSWQFLAAALPEARIIAPDLRGRGRSAELPAPYGISQHVDDLTAVMSAMQLLKPLEGRSLTVIGHSLGAFVGVEAIRQLPGVFGRALLADGGLPLTVPLNIDDDDLVEAVLGVAVARRTELTFTSLAIYRKFWRLHPGFASGWSDELGLVADYDLAEVVADDGSVHYRPVSSREAIEVDARELYGSHAIRGALCDLRDKLAHENTLVPAITVLTAPRGLLNESPGVYSERELAGWKAELPFLTFTEVPNVNHYSMVLSARGATAIAKEFRTSLVCA
ncbi:alpha/beta fold hydrolase [Subtercola lobariae]|uniref:Alpha/beta hydrolase n=1 Tax=Subtercola lobariae TaxID=1588641 RepID=A0A917B600_9MICO|nr:alpha/beta hydrolase [Subtercola lobariae]GGF24584.1 alpha/beta hydrolase [Subtercola lobariae]